MTPLALLALAVFADPLPVPADALAVVQLRGLGHLRERTAGLLTAVAPDHADGFARRLEAGLKMDGRDLTALDPFGRVFLAVLPGEAMTPTWAIYLPSRDYRRVRENVFTADERAAFRPGPLGFDTTVMLGGTLHLIDRTVDGYVVLTPTEPTAKWLAAAPRAMTAESLGAAAGPFLGSDLGVYVNLPAVTARYGGLMAGTRLMLPRMLTGGAFGLPRMEPRQADQIATVVGGVLQVVADGRGFAVGLNLGPAGVTVEVAVTVRPGTPTARVLGGGGGVAAELLDALPGGQAAYSAASFAVETAAAIEQAFPEYRNAHDVRSPGRPPTAIRQHWATAGMVAGPTLELFGPAGAVAAHLEVVRSLRRLAAHQNLPLARLPELLVRAERLGRLVFDRVSLEYDFAAATAAVLDPGVRQAAHATMRQLVGDRCDYWLAADAGEGVRVTAADWATARPLVTAYLGDGPRADDDPEVRAVRRRLPADASAVVLLDAAAVTCRAGAVLHGVVDALPAFPGLELPEFVAPANRSPFLGLAVTTRPDAILGRLVLPTAALKAAVGTVRFDPAP